MAIRAGELQDKSTDELLEMAGPSMADSPMARAIDVELHRRALIAQAEAAQAQAKASAAQEDAAKHAMITSVSARISAVAITIPALVALYTAFFSG